MRKAEFYFLATVVLLPFIPLTLLWLLPFQVIGFISYLLAILAVPAVVALTVSSVMMKQGGKLKIFLLLTGVSAIVLGMLAFRFPRNLQTQVGVTGFDPLALMPKQIFIGLVLLMSIGIVGSIVLMVRQRTRKSDSSGARITRKFILVNALAVAALLIFFVGKTLLADCEKFMTSYTTDHVVLFGVWTSDCAINGCVEGYESGPPSYEPMRDLGHPVRSCESRW